MLACRNGCGDSLVLAGRVVDPARGHRRGADA